MVQLNTQQEEAKNLIVKWFNNNPSGENLIFTLAGYAGVGKTFLIDYVINEVLKLPKNKVAFVAPTGKAASLLVQKGNRATTIHRLVYNYVDSEKKDKNGNAIPKFIKKSEIPNFKLIVVDEVSMVSADILKDIISFNIPILAVGDPGQIPPVLATSNKLLLHPDYTLTEIVRQSEGNQIIYISFLARTGKEIPCGKYGDTVIVINREDIPEQEYKNILLKADQIICGKNSTRVKINNYIRDLKGFREKTPECGDKIICCQNNYNISLDKEGDFPLVNGTIGTVTNYKTVNDEEHLGKLRLKAEFLDKETDEDIIIDQSIFTSDNHNFIYDRHQHVYKMKDGQYKVSLSLKKQENMTSEEHKKIIASEIKRRCSAVKELQISDFDFAYAISVHKAQGSQFRKVILFDESDCFKAYKNQWLYTAITRASEKLIIIK